MATNDTVVGVFLNEQYAQQAIQMLEGAGVKARIADSSALDAFRSTGMDEEVIGVYQSRMSEGNSIVVANAGTNGEDVLGMMLDGGAEYINLNTAGTKSKASTGSSRNDMSAQSASEYKSMASNQRQYGRVDTTTGRAKSADEIQVQLRQETLTASKTSAQAGEVEIRKTVHEKQEQIPVTLRHEEVVIERHAVDRPLAPGEITDMQDQVISVPVYEERAELQKQVRVAEEITIGKRTQEEQKTLSGTTHHEHLEIEQSGNIEVVGDTEAEVRTTQTNKQTGKKNR